MFTTDFPELPPFFHEHGSTWWGGVGVVAYKLALQLARFGHCVEVATSGAVDRDQVSSIENVRVHRYQSNFRLGATEVSLKLLCGSLEKRPDVVHAHSGSPPGLFGGWIAANRFRVPLVVTLHGDLFLERRTPIQSMILRSYSVLERFILSQASTIIVLTEAGMKSRELTNWKSKVRVIPNGVDPANRSDSGVKARARSLLGIPLDAKVCLFVGTLNYRKGADILLKAAELIRKGTQGVLIVMAGHAPDLNELLSTITNFSEVDGAVRVEGFVDEARKRLLCEAADLLIVPSRLEGLPLIILEAFASGLPVLASDIEPLKAVIDIGRNGLCFAAGDSSDLAAKVTATLNDHEFLERLGRGAYETATHYSWSVVAEHTARLYEMVSRGQD